VPVLEGTSELLAELCVGFAYANVSSIKKWKCPEGIFVHNFTGHEAIINTLSMNEEGVMFSGGELVYLLEIRILTIMQPIMARSQCGTTRLVFRSNT
jgi:hypothetical protein